MPSFAVRIHFLAVRKTTLWLHYTSVPTKPIVSASIKGQPMQVFTINSFLRAFPTFHKIHSFPLTFPGFPGKWSPCEAVNCSWEVTVLEQTVVIASTTLSQPTFSQQMHFSSFRTGKYATTAPIKLLCKEFAVHIFSLIPVSKQPDPSINTRIYEILWNKVTSKLN